MDAVELIGRREEELRNEFKNIKTIGTNIKMEV
jgi:hypothetical protein